VRSIVELPTYAYALNDPVNDYGLDGRIPNSVAARALVLSARGDFAGASALLIAAGYPNVGAAVLELQWAFDRAQQVAGPCFQVAQRISTAFQQLGRSPVAMQVRTGMAEGPAGRIARQAADGTWVQVSTNGLHAVVESGGRYFDAFTGPQGQTLEQFMATTASGMPSTFPRCSIE
jgi:hypothetical protein